MGRSADSGIMHPKSIGDLLHRIITGLICLLHAFFRIWECFNKIIERLPRTKALKGPAKGVKALYRIATHPSALYLACLVKTIFLSPPIPM
ncbi:MAG: hypothetical protein DID89_2727548611 [Candidatus Nitrotoga sp. CP45]|nr:MAG: hypothetical protein DID89_2727548611 [Candidatus Nitrotoga sp. CP45]